MAEFIAWNHLNWLGKFHQRSNDRDHYRSLRREVWKNTVEIIQVGSYRSISGKVVTLDQDVLEQAQYKTRFYVDSREIMQHSHLSNLKQQVFTIGADCLETSRLLQIAGYNPAVLNMADSYTPGGGVAGGSGAQEENLFRRSTALTSLFQYVDFGGQYGIPRNMENSYPIPEGSAGIYSPDLIVFRSSEQTGYYLLDNPYRMHMITVAAYSHPPLKTFDGLLQIAEHMTEPTKEKIRAILRIGYAHGHDCLVLSAFGCGAFANPPEHMARLFKEVLSEDEFVHSFKLIVFAIIDDYNANKSHNPNGNLLPFQVELNFDVL